MQLIYWVIPLPSDKLITVKSLFRAVWPVKSRHMCIKVAQKMISLEKLKILTPLQELPKNVGDFGTFIVAKDFKKLPKVQ